MIKHYSSARIKRKTRIRSKIKGTLLRPRLSVFRSNYYTYAQIINDEKGETLVAASEKELKVDKKHSKTERASLIGQLLAKKALKAGIKKIVFDRGSYKYHGRVKTLAERAREGGLKF
ncbi:50S ribosomal protein L18 [Candidatus Microgenomates bacterium]|nr:50S ribosomal protein L18 [Candidatus Microgenomates bacterium]